MDSEMKPYIPMSKRALEEGMAEAEKWIRIENENPRPVFPLPTYVATASQCSPVKRPAPLAPLAPLAPPVSTVRSVPVPPAASAALRRAQLRRVLESLGPFTGEMIVGWATADRLVGLSDRVWASLLRTVEEARARRPPPPH